MKPGRILTLLVASIAVALLPACALGATAEAANEMSVLRQTAQVLCPARPGNAFSSPQLDAQGNVYRLACIFGAGHDTSISMERFKSQAEAESAFRAATPGHPARDYHGSPASSWEQPAALAPEGRERIWIGQVAQWLIQIKSFDDTAYAVTPDPGDAAETLYQNAAALGLFSK